MVDDFVVRERLFDHHQVEIVQAFQALRIGQRVGRIRVGHQQDIGEPFADFAHHFDVPARLDLHLDALVAGGEFGFDLLQKLRHRILNSDGDAAGNFATRSATDVPVERLAGHASFEIPHRDFQSAARHQVASDVRTTRPDMGRTLEFVMQHPRGDVIAQDHPGRFGPFFVVERIFAAGNFTPARKAIAFDFHQDDAALGGAAEAGLEEMHQRHADFAQCDSI
jgi:hypothetical protein